MTFKLANMVDVVQLVRASDCGSECRGFESHLPPRINPARFISCRVSCLFTPSTSFTPHALFAPHALKGQKLLAQGIALGYYGRKPVAL